MPSGLAASSYDLLPRSNDSSDPGPFAQCAGELGDGCQPIGSALLLRHGLGRESEGGKPIGASSGCSVQHV